MFGFSHAPELIILVLVAAFILGPKRLPEVSRTLGDAVRGFRKETEFLRTEATSIKDEITSVKQVAQERAHDAVTGAKAGPEERPAAETASQAEPPHGS